MITVDARGGHRTGPFGAWWAWLLPRPHRAGYGLEVPRGRAAGWNVVIATAAVTAFGLARLSGQLTVFLAVIGGMATVTAAAIYVIGTGVRDGRLGFRPPADAGEWQEPDADDADDEWRVAA